MPDAAILANGLHSGLCPLTGEHIRPPCPMPPMSVEGVAPSEWRYFYSYGDSAEASQLAKRVAAILQRPVNLRLVAGRWQFTDVDLVALERRFSEIKRAEQEYDD